MAKVKYKWTPEDAAHERAGYSSAQNAEDQLVTPYGHVAGNIPNAKSFKGSKDEPPHVIDLATAYGLPGWRDRFAKAQLENTDPRQTLVWEEIPADLLGATTLGQLCKTLHEKRPNVYPAYLYSDSELGKAGDKSYHLKMPQLLFDYWDNTELRYAVVTGGKYETDMSPTAIPIDPAQRWRTLALKPRPVDVAAKTAVENTAPCQQSVVNDPRHAKLRAESAQVRSKAATVLNLIPKAHEQLTARARAIVPFTALHVLFRCCGGLASFIGPDGNKVDPRGTQDNQLLNTSDAVIDTLERIIDVAKHKMLQTPMSELIAGAKKSAVPDKRIEEASTKLLGLKTDIAGEVDNNCAWLRQKLLNNSSYKKQLQELVDEAIKNKLLHEEPMRSLIADTVEATTLGLEALAEQMIEDDGEGYWRILEATRKQRATAPEHIKGDNAVELLASVAGFTTTAIAKIATPSNALSVVGNLEGPPSITVALLSIALNRKFGEGITTIAGLRELESRMIGQLAKFDFPEWPKFEQALKNNNHAELQKLRKAFGDHVCGSFQTSLRWKAFTNLLQIAGTVSALIKANDTRNSDSATIDVKVIDYTNAGIGVVSSFCGAIETWFSRNGPLSARGASRLKAIGNCLGYAQCVVGVVQGAMDMAEGICRVQEGQTLTGSLKFASGALTCAGSLVMLQGISTANPQCMAIGLSMTLAGTLVGVAHDIVSSDIEKAKKENNPQWSEVNSLALKVLATVQAADFFWTFYDEIRTDWKLLHDQIRQGAFGNVHNNPFHVDSLRRVGFNEKQIGSVVGATVVFDPNMMAKRAAAPLIMPPPLD